MNTTVSQLVLQAQGWREKGYSHLSILFHVRGNGSFPGLNFHSTDVESEPAVLKEIPPPPDDTIGRYYMLYLVTERLMLAGKACET